MTPTEHSIASSLASILLLRFLQPNHPPNIEQQISSSLSPFAEQSKHSSKKNSYTTNMDKANEDINEEFDFMLTKLRQFSLLERLENYTHFYSIQSPYPSKELSGINLSSIFHRFLCDGLSLFLSSRSAHVESTDLLDLIALSISPSILSFPKYQMKANERATNNETDIILSSVPQDMTIPSISQFFFQMNDTDRFQMVNMLCNHLTLPDVNISNNERAPLFIHTIPHLRASIRTFLESSLSIQQLITACKLLAHISLQTQNNIYIQEDTTTLITIMMETVTCYKSCNRNIHQNDNNSIHSSGCCYFSNITVILEDFIAKQCLNASKYWFKKYVKDTITQLSQSLKEVTAYNQNSNPASPCKVSSILNICTYVQNLCTYQKKKTKKNDSHKNQLDPVLKKQKLNSEDDNDFKTTYLIKTSIDLLSNEALIIVRSAALLLHSLLCSWCDQNKKDLISFCKDIFQKCKFLFLYHVRNDMETNRSSSIKSECPVSVSFAIQPLLAIFARQSKHYLILYVDYMLSLFYNKNIENDQEKFEKSLAKVLFQIVSKIAMLSPSSIAKRFDHIHAIMAQKLDENNAIEVIVSFLACRQYIEWPIEKKSSLYSDIHERIKNPWTSYKVARFALSTSNFDAAKEFYECQIFPCATEEKTHLWLTILNQVSAAEESVMKKGIIGLPEGISILNSSLTHLHSFIAIQENDSSTDVSFAFQIELISNRIDFFNLCVTAHSLGNEMILTGTKISCYTRSSLHERNIVLCFDALSKRYMRLYRVYGYLSCQQTKMALKTLSMLCRFMAKMTGKIFCKPVPPFSSADHFHLESSTRLPLKLMSKLNTQIMELLDEHIDVTSRSKILTQIMNMILTNIAPFPRAFLSIKPFSIAAMKLFADPVDIDKSQIKNYAECSENVNSSTVAWDDQSIAEIIEIQSGYSCTIYAKGIIPKPYITKHDPAICQIACSYTITYNGQTSSDDDSFSDEQRAIGNTYLDKEKIPSIPPTHKGEETIFVSQTFSHGKFLIPIECTPSEAKGFYEMQVKLFCRDILGNNWDIPTPLNDCIIIRVV